MMRNIETFPSKQMYPYLSLVEKKVADFYLNIDRMRWLVWLKWLIFITLSGQLMVSLYHTARWLFKSNQRTHFLLLWTPFNESLSWEPESGLKMWKAFEFCRELGGKLHSLVFTLQLLSTCVARLIPLFVSKSETIFLKICFLVHIKEGE